MAHTSTSTQRTIKGKKLTCIVCKHITFWERETLMNTKKLTFFKLEWLNKKAQNLICNNCGFVHWFLNK